ncbi:hypothetical protein J2W56_004253 [Nocardia kruczakiae]|uniref:DUF222 domain-containing protein n=1 Tax=Nocardia kruczakiae TaxID=261477 RepID=A0ABU1XKK2_9NOCA|nr:hypothetical protein [Nocardia kruczakiae]MDR7170502.1 hypothetical protein [Nocardia kruczakiae]
MPDDFDALDYAREQLRVLVEEADGTEVTREFRLGLGLLAAQVATAERMPLPASKPAPAVSIWGPAVAPDVAEAPDPVTVVAPDGSSTVWDVGLLGRILAAAKPAGVEMIKAIADEGGRISKDRFLEVTGRRSMAGMTQAVRSAITTASGDLMGPSARLVRRRHENDDESARVLELFFPEGLQPLVVYALSRHFASRSA